MTNGISKLFILFLLAILIVGWFPLTHFDLRKKPTSGGILLGAEELKCPSCSLKRLSFPAEELSEWKTFRSEKYGFEFRYPPDGQVQSNVDTKQKKSRVDLPVTEKTLLQDKFLLVKVEKASEKKPHASPGKGSGEEVFINDRKFVKEKFEEGAAGHLYEHTIYSTVEGDRRYSLDFVLHSVNSGVFESPPPGFDWRERLVFSKIASTFRFLD